MSFNPQPIVTDIADAILDWCGVTSPTSIETAAAQIAADTAKDTIMFYRRIRSAAEWKPATDYAVYDMVAPNEYNGHLYQCSIAGTSDAATRPAWPTTTGTTVTDGTVTWTEHTPAFEDSYRSLAIEMGVYLYTKRGVDGVLSMSENGVSRSYEKGSFPPSMLSRIALPVKAG